MDDCQLELLLPHCVSFRLSDFVRLLMYGEGWEFGEIAKWLGGDWHWEAPSSKRKFEGNDWRIDMKPGGKQLPMILWVYMCIANGHFTLFIKLQEVCGLCKGSFLPIERSSKKSRGHYEVITRSFIFPYYFSISFLPGPIDGHVPGTPAAPRPANGTWRAAASAASTMACAARRWAAAPSKIRNSKVKNGKPRVGFKVEKCGILLWISTKNYEELWRTMKNYEKLWKTS